MGYIIELFGNNIRTIRERKKLSIEELATKIGVSYQTLSGIELGNAFVRADTMEKICNSLEISPKMLFETENLPSQLSQKSYYKPLISEIVEHLDENTQESLYKLIKLFLEELKK